MAFLKALSNQPDLQGRKGPQNTSKSIMLLPKLAACAVLQPEEALPPASAQHEDEPSAAGGR